MKKFVFVLSMLVAVPGCDGDCVLDTSASGTSGGREPCSRVPPADASQPFAEGFWSFMLGPYPPVPPGTRCPTPDSELPACQEWWDGAGEGAKAAAMCEAGFP